MFRAFMEMRLSYRLTILCFAMMALIMSACSSGYCSKNEYLESYDESSLLLDIAPPKTGSMRERRAGTVFHKTRNYEGSARWKQAIHDADLTPVRVLAGYNCATQRNFVATPTVNFYKLLHETSAFRALSFYVVSMKRSNPLFLHISLSENRFMLFGICSNAYQMRRSKKYFRVKLQFVRYQGRTCSMAVGYDYPSSHAMYGWIVALLFAQISPEQKKAIYAHARSFAESRVICGVHSLGAVEGDEYYAKRLFAQLKRSAAFMCDLDVARAEMHALPHKRTNANCEPFLAQFVKEPVVRMRQS